jgi:uncharacterized membrane protein
MFYSPETCAAEGGDFEMMGWWRIAPGSCAVVYGNDLADLNRFWYYYAEAADGSFWAGPFGATVPVRRFGGDQACWGVQHSATEGFVRIGYRELDIGDNDDYTLTLVP